MEQRKVHVLLVDDEQDFLEPVSFWLQSKGYRVTTANSGQAALDVIHRGTPDIVFLDIHMPGMDGLETLRHIRETHKDLPVIIVTAVYQDEKNFSTANKLGISGFFPKQSTLSELTSIIQTCLKAHAKLKPSPPSEG